MEYTMVKYEKKNKEVKKKDKNDYVHFKYIDEVIVTSTIFKNS